MYIDRATVTINATTFANNSAADPFNNAAKGGAIYTSSDISVAIVFSYFQGNNALYGGGMYESLCVSHYTSTDIFLGIYGYISSAYISATSFTGNNATYGGGVYLESNPPSPYGGAQIQQSNFTQNSASFGGGIYASTAVQVFDSYVSP